jgi:hypothetical protein
MVHITRHVIYQLVIYQKFSMRLSHLFRNSPLMKWYSTGNRSPSRAGFLYCSKFMIGISFRMRQNRAVTHKFFIFCTTVNIVWRWTDKSKFKKHMVIAHGHQFLMAIYTFSQMSHQNNARRRLLYQYGYVFLFTSSAFKIVSALSDGFRSYSCKNQP